MFGALVVASHGLVTSAAAVKAGYIGEVDVADAAKAAPPNSRACRIRLSSHLFYDCIRN